MKTNPLLIRHIVCYLIRDGKVLLGERKSSSRGLGIGRVAGIGGKVADLPGLEQETETQAVLREVYEETGCRVTSFHPAGTVLFLFPSKPKWNETVAVYIADAYEGEPKETESMAPAWFDMHNLPYERMWADARHWIPQVLQGKRVSARFLYGPDNVSIIEKDIAVG